LLVSLSASNYVRRLSFFSVRLSVCLSVCC